VISSIAPEERLELQEGDVLAFEYGNVVAPVVSSEIFIVVNGVTVRRSVAVDPRVVHEVSVGTAVCVVSELDEFKNRCRRRYRCGR